jgi:hypothetical protein
VCRFSSAAQWARDEFGRVRLGDARRTRRAVTVAAAMARDPSGSIPQQSKTRPRTKGAYRLFDAADVTFEAMIDPHWQRTRTLAGERPVVVLLVQDTTELDYTSHPGCQGLGRLGNGEGWEGGLGLLLHNVLAIEPLPDGESRVLGLAWNKLWARTEPVPAKRRTAKQRREQGCESDRWAEAVRAIGGPPPGGARFVHVGDREADIFPLYRACRGLPDVSFLVRVHQTRRAAVGGHVPEPGRTVKADDRPGTTLRDVVDAMPAPGDKRVWVAPRGGRAGRWAKLRVGGGPVTVYSPWRRSRSGTPLCCWAVRVWEADAPEGVEPVEWVLLSDEPVRDAGDALRLCDWYALRWTVEQFHQCLKSGCKVEARQLEHVDRLHPLIAMCCVLAVRLLNLKHDARRTPDAPAIEHVPRESVRTLARMLKVADGRSITVRRFTREVAKLGGFPGRKSDGEPGWLTLWRGWHELDLITQGRLLSEAEPRCG